MERPQIYGAECLRRIALVRPVTLGNAELR
jgi:hypothetical protein